MNDELADRIERLSPELVDLMGQLDDTVTESQVPPKARDLARKAREAGERLIAAVKELNDPEALKRAEHMAACAVELDRDINGGTLQ